MASLLHLGDFNSTSNATVYTTGGMTPTVGDLLVVLVEGTTATDATATLTDSAGGTYTLLHGQSFQAGNSHFFAFVADQLVAAATSRTFTFTLPSDAAGGVIISVERVVDAADVGAAAIVQSKGAFAAGGTTPQVVLDAAVDPANVVLAGVGSTGVGLNPLAITPPTGLTERVDTGHNSPAAGLESASADSGISTATITWGSSLSSGWGAVVLEIAAAAGGGANVTGTASLSSAGSLAASGEREVVGQAILDSQGNLAATGQREVVGQATLDSQGDLSASGQRSVFGVAGMDSAGQLTLQGLRTVFGAAMLESAGMLTASGSTEITDQPAYKSLRVDAYLGSTAFATQMDEAIANGAQHVRFSAQWDLVETSNGTFVWTKLDQAVNACVAAGIKCTVHIIKTPAWVGTADQWDPPVHDSTQLNHWRDFITELVTRYGTDIDIYEVWNEPNGATFNHSPSAQSAWPGEYADLMRNACEAAKAVNPDVKIGGMVTNRSLISGFMEEVYDALEADMGVPTCQANNYYYDYLSLHPYCLTHAPTFAAGGDDISDAWGGDIGRSFNDFTRARDIVIAREGAPKPIYFGEFGYNTDGSTNNGPVADATRAGYLTDAYDICRADGGIYALTWYSWQAGPAAWDIDGHTTETAFIDYPMVSTDVVGSASLVSSGVLTADGLRTVSGSATLDSSGELAAEGFRTVLGAAELSSSGVLTASFIRTVLGAAGLTSAAILSAEGQREVLGAASLSSSGVLVAVGVGTTPDFGVVVGVFDLADGALVASFTVPARSLDVSTAERSLELSDAVRSAEYDSPTRESDF